MSHDPVSVETIVKNAVAEFGCEIFDLRIVPRKRIQLVIERKAGTLPLDVIARVHKKISHTLEDEGHDWMAYVIDVATPGVNRPIRSKDEFPFFLGKRIRVKFRDESMRNASDVGELVSSDADGILLKAESGVDRKILHLDIQGAHLDPKLPF